MSNLIVEYQKRHKDNAIPLCHNGVCFFDSTSKNASPTIVLTSLCCRTFGTCISCGHAENIKLLNRMDYHLAPPGDMVVELFRPGYGGSFQMHMHHHTDPCGDLTELLKKWEQQLKPFYAKKNRDLEFWLWNACSKGKIFKTTETDKELKILDQMVYAAQKQSKVYMSYYTAYESFLLLRKYLLFQ